MQSLELSGLRLHRRQHEQQRAVGQTPPPATQTEEGDVCPEQVHGGENGYFEPNELLGGALESLFYGAYHGNWAVAWRDEDVGLGDKRLGEGDLLETVNEEFQLQVQRQRARWASIVANLDHSNGESLEYEEDDGDRSDEDQNDVRNIYQDSTWKKESFIFSPPPKDFTGFGGTRKEYHRMPTYLMLFRLYWLDTILIKIVTKTNRYAATQDEDGQA
jgi:hypothetical protein